MQNLRASFRVDRSPLNCAVRLLSGSTSESQHLEAEANVRKVMLVKFWYQRF
jgi:hypothetical protein